MKIPLRLYHPLNVPFSDHGGPARDNIELLDSIAFCPEEYASQQLLTIEVSESFLDSTDETPQGPSIGSSLTRATCTPSADSYQ